MSREAEVPIWPGYPFPPWAPWICAANLVIVATLLGLGAWASVRSRQDLAFACRRLAVWTVVLTVGGNLLFVAGVSVSTGTFLASRVGGIFWVVSLLPIASWVFPFAVGALALKGKSRER